MTRVLTALVLVPVVAGVVLYGPDWAFLLLTAVVGVFAFREFDAIVAGHGIHASGWFGIAAGLALLLSPEPLLPVIVVIGLGLMALGLRAEKLESVLAGAAAALLGVIYIFGAWRCAALLRDANPHWLMLALLVSWVGDSAALYAGRTCGRRKLAARISPDKTWEGSAASIVFGTLVGMLYAHFLIPGSSLTLATGVAAAANAFGQLGDLCESALKRGAGLKDSGDSLPGHGGWLDRVDSTLFSIPAVYLLLRLGA
jgi:phosphatidate cytidylyltransferase